MLLAEYDSPEQQKNLAESIKNFKFIILMATYTQSTNKYVLASTIVPSSYFDDFNRVMACMNDGTVRKVELRKDSDTSFTSSTASGFSNVTKAVLYGAIHV